MATIIVDTVRQQVVMSIPVAFIGCWSNKYNKNIPGPIYSTTDNVLSLSSSSKSREHILYDNECEFIWKQPETLKETQTCILAISGDETASYQIDGNKHWTIESIRQWWKSRKILIEWSRALLQRPVKSKHEFWSGNASAIDEELVISYLNFLEHGKAGHYLRRYMYFLLEDQFADANALLPEL